MEQTRTCLHGVAELLLAGPQHAESGTAFLREGMARAAGSGG